MQDTYVVCTQKPQTYCRDHGVCRVVCVYLIKMSRMNLHITLSVYVMAQKYNHDGDWQHNLVHVETERYAYTVRRPVSSVMLLALYTW